MSKFNLFFSMTGKNQKYTEDYIINLCSDFLIHTGITSFDNLFQYVQEHYGENCKINYSAFRKVICHNFQIDKKQLVECRVNSVNLENILIDIDDCLCLINADNINCPIELYFHDEKLINKFKSVNIYFVRDIKSSSVKTLLHIFSNPLDILNALRNMRVSYFSIYVDKIKNGVSGILDNRSENIICQRNGYFDSNSITLAEISDQLKLTRERVRQIELRSMAKLAEIASMFSYDISFILDKFFCDNNLLYTTKKELINNYRDERFVLLLLFLIIQRKSGYSYSSRYQIIYKEQENSIEDLEEKILSKFDVLISNNLFDLCSTTEKKIILNGYSFSREYNAYKKKSVKLSDILEQIMVAEFPNGYHYYNEDDYLLFKEKFIKRFGNDVLTPSFISLRGLLDRGNFCLSDRGTIISKNQSVNLDKLLLEKIILYLSEFDDIAYYASIFNKFRKELSILGIQNRYYLKGILDPYLPSEYITKRDYISVGNEFITSNESINIEITKFKKDFSLDDLKLKYPGVKDYVFQLIISEREDIVSLSSKRFILFHNLNINNNLKIKLKEEIEFLFSYLKISIISSGKIYSRMLIMHGELMRSIALVNNKYALYSLLSILFKNDYCFRRQYISKGCEDDITANSLIEEFVDNFNSFTSNDIKDFVEKMNIRKLYSFQEFIIRKSDEFIQVSVDKCIKKDILKISEYNLKKISDELNYYINSYGEINTCYYYGFSALPNIGYEWNKYLLVGIIRCYFEERYLIKYTDTMSTKTDYIIRRVD